MENKIIGKFTVKTFNNNFYEFLVKEDGYIYSDILQGEKIKHFVIKPKFELFMADGGSRILNNNSSMDLVESYFIGPQLLEFLVLKNRVSYSADMAYLYGFNPDYAFDRRDQKRAFKRIKSKEKILTKQKQGIFN